ncbi:3'-5' exonuclease [Hymenobacter sp. AT01-02]|uniref:3'-5' exonuclease n=1 Tax=Hymenobacter sp. AT01-02 TaxID=1571877 RepID=UPI0005F215DD|nr:3'-5' exonuclease [Hymenobacter sp. AT01-02]
MFNTLPYYLFFDTETSGIPQNFYAPASDTDNWPRVVQLAWALYDEAGDPIEHKNYLIRPDGFAIPQEATLVHGISHARAVAEGTALADVLEDFAFDLSCVKKIVAHNINFDTKVVGAEFHRLGITSQLETVPKICTMEIGTDYCRFPAAGSFKGHSYKWPKLGELYQEIFGHEFKGAHDALNDVMACVRCFFAMQYMGLVA